jgi:hypothetical protein
MKKEEKVEETAVQQGVAIGGINVQKMNLTLVGTSPLICNRFSEENEKKMIDKQTKSAGAKAGRAAKDPEADFRKSLYVMKDGRYGFPASGFKQTAVGACTFSDDFKKTQMRGAFHIIADDDEGLVHITGVPVRRQDRVKLNGIGGTTDIHFRGMFPVGWTATLHIKYNANAISAAQLVQIFEVAGFSIGVGDWRPQRNGSFGMFEVAKNKPA